jgi:hypothetical protein
MFPLSIFSPWCYYESLPRFSNFLHIIHNSSSCLLWHVIHYIFHRVVPHPSSLITLLVIAASIILLPAVSSATRINFHETLPDRPYSPPTDPNKYQRILDDFSTLLQKLFDKYLNDDVQLPIWKPQDASENIQRHIASLSIPTLQASSRIPSLLLHNLGQPSHDRQLADRVEEIFRFGSPTLDLLYILQMTSLIASLGFFATHRDREKHAFFLKGYGATGGSISPYVLNLRGWVRLISRWFWKDSGRSSVYQPSQAIIVIKRPPKIQNSLRVISFEYCMLGCSFFAYFSNVHPRCQGA